MADHPEPNPALKATCDALEPLGWIWDPVSNSCISPGKQPATGLPTLPTLPTKTEVPTGHVIVTQEELVRLERERDSARTQRNFAFGGIALGVLLGAVGGYALAK